MTESEKIEKAPEGRRDGGRGLLVAAAVATVVIAVGIGAVFVSRGSPATAASDVERATAFWVAVSAGDRETAISYLDPATAESGGPDLFGRALTLEGNFDWYEAIGWQWTLDQCVEVVGGGIECTVSIRNDWSDAIGLDPIVGVYEVEVGKSGITAFVDKDENLRSQWIPQAFELFARWVDTHHPADAVIMWGNREIDVNQEILDLYRINTDRFVEAYPNG